MSMQVYFRTDSNSSVLNNLYIKVSFLNDDNSHVRDSLYIQVLL